MVFNGTTYVILNDSQVIGASSNSTLSIDQDTEEVQTKSTPDNWKRRIVTAKDWQIDWEGMHDPQYNYNAEEILDKILSTDVETAIVFQPSSPVLNDMIISGTGIIKGITIESPNQAPQLLKASWIGSSMLVKTLDDGVSGIFDSSFDSTFG